MFRKKKTAEAPRERQRPVGQTPQSTAVFSYHTSRMGTSDPRGRQNLAEQESQRLERPKIRKLHVKPKSLALAFVVMLVFIASVSVSTTPKIVLLGDNNSMFVQNTVQYQKTASSLLNRSILNKNKLTVNANAITQEMNHAYPEIHAATLALPIIGRQPTLYLQPALPQLVLATKSGGQFILDSTGRALAVVNKRVTLPTGVKALPVVVDESGISVKPGDIALPAQSVQFVTEVAGQLHAKQLRITSWKMPAQASELDVYIEGVSYYVRFNLQGNPREQAGTFLATKSYLESNKKTASQYIDVRVSGHAYYK